ncbi:MAG: hypothetical protein ACFFC7_24660 [Candidatus Hermodarchaeota archaeon]
MLKENLNNNKPFSWIARQPYSIRYEEKEIRSDNEPESEDFLKDMPLAEDIEFERGKFWPTFILVENLWSHEPEETDIYLRLFRKSRNIIVDIWKGHDLTVASRLAKRFNIPIYTIFRTRTGKKTVVRRMKAKLFEK